MRILLMVWNFAVAAKTLLPSLNRSLVQNVSIVGETWAKWDLDDQHQPHTVEEKKWETASQISVIIQKDEETDIVHSMKLKKEKHELQQKEKMLIRDQENCKMKEQEKTVFIITVNQTENLEKQVEIFNKTIGKYLNITQTDTLHDTEDLHSSHLPTIQVFNQLIIPPTTRSPPTTISSLSITTQNVSTVTNFNAKLESQNIFLSITKPNPFLVKTTMDSPSSNSTSHDFLKAVYHDVHHTSHTGKADTSSPKHANSKKNNKQIIQIKKTKLKLKSKTKAKKTKPVKKVKLRKRKKHELSTGSHYPYFQDDYCPSQCNCYGRMVQCSDKELENVPFGIPYSSHDILLMNNHIQKIPLSLFSKYVSMETLVLSNNRLMDNSTQGAFKGIRSLKRLFIEQNLFQSVSSDLPVSLEELHLDGNQLKVMSETTWSCCPRLLILSLNNNSLTSSSSSILDGVFSSLSSLQTLSLSHNSLTSIPQHLPLSLQQLYLRGNLISSFQAGVFQGKAQLLVLDLSTNKLTNKGLGKDVFINATCLESLNLQGNVLQQVPSHLPHSLKTLNLEENSISRISKATLLSLPNLEHLSLARNKIFKVVPGAFQVLPSLHQLDLSHNMLHQVPRQLPACLVYIALNNNKIQIIPRDAFCSVQQTEAPKNSLLKVQLENNLLDMAMLDNLTLSCLRGVKVVYFY